MSCHIFGLFLQPGVVTKVTAVTAQTEQCSVLRQGEVTDACNRDISSAARICKLYLVNEPLCGIAM